MGQHKRRKKSKKRKSRIVYIPVCGDDPDVEVVVAGLNLFQFFLVTDLAAQWVDDFVEIPPELWLGAHSFGVPARDAQELASRMAQGGLCVR